MMMKPSDFSHPKYWLLHEWREWNPIALVRKISRFARNILAYRKVLWHDRDFDYSYLLEVMELKLRRMSRHFDEHAIVVDSDKIARECLVAAELCRRLLEDEYGLKDVLNGNYRKRYDLYYLSRLMSRKMFCWWD